jgi:hypothetical protein
MAFDVWFLQKKPAIFVHKRANAAHDAAQDDGYD